jgi:hypothetical protein
MRRANIDLLHCIRFDPPVKHATTRKHQSMNASVVDDSQLKLAIESRCDYFLPRL